MPAIFYFDAVGGAWFGLPTELTDRLPMEHYNHLSNVRQARRDILSLMRGQTGQSAPPRQETPAPGRRYGDSDALGIADIPGEWHPSCFGEAPAFAVPAWPTRVRRQTI
jgi:hypothetical protein